MGRVLWFFWGDSWINLIEMHWNFPTLSSSKSVTMIVELPRTLSSSSSPESAKQKRRTEKLKTEKKQFLFVSPIFLRRALREHFWFWIDAWSHHHSMPLEQTTRTEHFWGCKVTCQQGPLDHFCLVWNGGWPGWLVHDDDDDGTLSLFHPSIHPSDQATIIIQSRSHQSSWWERLLVGNRIPFGNQSKIINCQRKSHTLTANGRVSRARRQTTPHGPDSAC